GRVPLRMTDGGTDLKWRAERFAAMNRPDMRLVVTGDGNVRFTDKKIALVGQLQANRGYFEIGDNQLPELSDDVVIVGEQRKVVQKQADTQFPIQLDLRLSLGNDLRLFAYGYQGYLGGRLRLYTNPAGLLRAEGRINTDRGRFTAYGKRLEVEKGIVTFDGPVDNPTLQVEAWQRNQAVEVGVKISGTVESPQVQLVSEPPVPEGEKLSWLVLGRAPGDAQGADLALLQAAAGTLFGRGDAVGINQRIAQQLGLDDVSFRGSGQLTGNVVALGKRFSDKVYVTVEQGIGLAQSLVKLDYSLSRRWSARLETGNVSGVGLFYRIAFD
ncbi:MAG TPA: translocation/assembly module TamB domain-containing protein, partial [Burkholderiales bacterium]